jgi:hypothetical protein
MRETRDLLVKFTEGEIKTRKEEHYAVLRTIDEIKGKHKEELKPHKDKVKSLVSTIELGGEVRPVECEWRDSLVNGGAQECVRLDTLEIVDRLDDDQPIEDERQPTLFDSPRPSLPELRCTAIDEDGEAHPISAEQADTAERSLSALGGPIAIVREDGSRIERVVKVMRAKACETCSAADGNHRPECAEMKADEIEPDLTDVRDYPNGEADHIAMLGDDYDRNDTAEVAAKIAEVAPPNDKPLTRGVETATAKPKRNRKGANGAGEREASS